MFSHLKNNNTNLMKTRLRAPAKLCRNVFDTVTIIEKLEFWSILSIHLYIENAASHKSNFC